MSALDDLVSEIGDLLTAAAPLTPEQRAALQRYGGYQLLSGVNGTTNPPVNEGKDRTAPARYPVTPEFSRKLPVKVHHVNGAFQRPTRALLQQCERLRQEPNAAKDALSHPGV
jgi:hypothetical protein